MFSAVSKTIQPRRRDLLGGFEVSRVLPALEQRSVGPFVFLDHMGPAKFAAGKGLDVRPHPHIGLATVTYLFEGEIMHKDNLGTEQAIRPGDVNWMVAGKGIVHSERTRTELRRAGSSLHGIQSWFALPKKNEEMEPSFEHVPAARLPMFNRGDMNVRLILGNGFGLKSPVKIFSPTLYADVMMADRASFDIPADYAERAIYVVEGTVEISGMFIEAGTMATFLPELTVTLHAKGARTRFMVIGGEPIDGSRHLWWNFVASDEDKLARARTDWSDAVAKGFKNGGRFGLPPGETEAIPLPKT
ncbi:MAG: pirin family protein [Rhodospirillaceae bacterium]|nr:pirin family protein [Rhodospirillaceae bacterium]